MSSVFKALVSTAFMALVGALFVGGFTAVVVLSITPQLLVLLSMESIAAVAVLIGSVFFFRRALAYERYGDAHKPSET